jgi:hypothetical protein
MVIERDTVCPCGACQTASNLTLKFIIHFGYIKEIKVAQFVKATGIDMIVAHRLLKNDLDENEYILITEPCCSAVGQEDGGAKLQWAKSSQAYEMIGNVGFEVGEGCTRLNFNVNWMGATLPADKKQDMMAGQAANFELFKKVCETNPA